MLFLNALFHKVWRVVKAGYFQVIYMCQYKIVTRAICFCLGRINFHRIGKNVRMDLWLSKNIDILHCRCSNVKSPLQSALMMKLKLIALAQQLHV